MRQRTTNNLLSSPFFVKLFHTRTPGRCGHLPDTTARTSVGYNKVGHAYSGRDNVAPPSGLKHRCQASSGPDLQAARPGQVRTTEFSAVLPPAAEPPRVTVLHRIGLTRIVITSYVRRPKFFQLQADTVQFGACVIEPSSESAQ